MMTAETKNVLTDVSNKLDEACGLLADGIIRARGNYDRDGVITLAYELIDVTKLQTEIHGMLSGIPVSNWREEDGQD